MFKLAGVRGFQSLNLNFGKLQRIAAFGLVLATAGCGVSYTSPAVRTHDEETPVNVVELNAASVSVANRSSYSPRSLPAEFFGTAGGGSLIGAGALPAVPYVPEERR